MRFSPAHLELLRTEQDMSRSELAGIVAGIRGKSVTAHQVQTWELGRIQPRASMLGHLAVALNCSIDDFFTAEDLP